MAVARPATDEVVERDIMVVLLVLSGAPWPRDGRSTARPWMWGLRAGRERGLGAL